MRRHLIAVPLVAAGLALAGCGGGPVESAPPASPPPATTAALAPPAPEAAESPEAELLSRDGSTLYVVETSGERTKVLALDPSTRATQRSLWLDGVWELTTVAADGSVTGLSADGETLVLQQTPAHGRTRFAVLGTAFDKPPHVVRLPGRYTLDGVAVDGSVLFLVRYADAVGSERYDVVSYDLLTRHLSTPLVDKRDPDEKMQGQPLARLTSPAGDWAYTLYGGHHAFVHVLPLTREITGLTFCVDLEGLPAQGHAAGQRWTLTLSTDGHRLTAANADAGVDAVVDLVDFVQIA